MCSTAWVWSYKISRKASWIKYRSVVCLQTKFMWYFQVRCSSRYTPRNLVALLWIRGWPPKEREKLWLSFLWLGLKVTWYVFLILTESLLHLTLTSIFSNSLLSTFFLGPISSKITLTIGKKRRKRKSDKEERSRREKSNGCTLSFHNSYFGDTFFPKKKLSDVHLAVTFSKIQLDICVCVCCICR